MSLQGSFSVGRLDVGLASVRCHTQKPVQAIANEALEEGPRGGGARGGGAIRGDIFQNWLKRAWFCKGELWLYKGKGQLYRGWPDKGSGTIGVCATGLRLVPQRC